MEKLNSPHLVALAAAVFLLAFSVTSAQLNSSSYGGQRAQVSKSSGLNILIDQGNTRSANTSNDASNAVPRGPILTRDNVCDSVPLPPGVATQTVYCDGQNWVVASNLLNDGTNVGVGASPIADAKLSVAATPGNISGIYSYNSNYESFGVKAVAPNGGIGLYALGGTVGVDGTGRIGVRGIARLASPNSIGVYAIGSDPSSLAFQADGKIKIVDGTQGAGKVLTSGPDGLASWQAPSGGSGGGGLLGYEIISTEFSSSPHVSAFCPSGKRVVTGGCRLAGLTVPIHTSAPYTSGNGWQCGWIPNPLDPDTSYQAYAVCAFAD